MRLYYSLFNKFHSPFLKSSFAFVFIPLCVWIIFRTACGMFVSKIGKVGLNASMLFKGSSQDMYISLMESYVIIL